MEAASLNSSGAEKLLLLLRSRLQFGSPRGGSLDPGPGRTSRTVLESYFVSAWRSQKRGRRPCFCRRHAERAEGNHEGIQDVRQMNSEAKPYDVRSLYYFLPDRIFVGMGALVHLWSELVDKGFPPLGFRAQYVESRIRKKDCSPDLYRLIDPSQFRPSVESCEPGFRSVQRRPATGAAAPPPLTTIADRMGRPRSKNTTTTRPKQSLPFCEV